MGQICILTVQTVFFSALRDLVLGQSVLRVDPEVVAALLPRLHVAVLHGEGSVAPLEREKVPGFQGSGDVCRVQLEQARDSASP